MFAHDPLGAFERVRDNFILFLLTAFRTRSPWLDREREDLLRRTGEFVQEPFVEPRLKYRGATAVSALGENDLPNMVPVARTAFKALLGAVLFPGESARLYDHQAAMLRLVLGGSNGVVTTGTGSGKTEAFLMPLLARLVNERFTRRKRNPGMRAVVLYPMNALVEDQLNRLRVVLDSDPARKWRADYKVPYPVTFARYNSLTPVPGYQFKCEDGDKTDPTGEENDAKVDRLREELRGISRASAGLDRLIQAAEGRVRQANGEKELATAREELDRLREARSFIPRYGSTGDGAELVSRWDIQASPPDILVTNFSMLSIMLMRAIEAQIFDQTREWLKTDPDAVFHLVVDELHLYRGTAGTEVAYLVRLLLDRLGIHPNHNKLRIVASSASLGYGAEATEFLAGFFGCEWSAE